MTTEERALVSDFFDRLAASAAQPRDPEVEALIRAKIAENPAATYYLAQSALVFQQAAKGAQARIAALENELALTRSGTQPHSPGFLSGVSSFFDGKREEPARPSPPPVPPQTVPFSPPPAAGRGGGFLQTALSTAAGVAGGALLFQGIENLLGHNPGPFGGAAIPSGGFPGQTQPTENIEVVNNYYGGDAPADTPTQDFAGLGSDGSGASNDDINLFSDNPGDFSLGNDPSLGDTDLVDDSFLGGGDDDGLNS